MKKILSLILITGLILQILFNGFIVNAVEEKTITPYLQRVEDTPEYKEALEKYKSEVGSSLLGVVDAGTKINSIYSQDASYSPDGKYIIYQASLDSYRRYKKNADDNSNGSPIFPEPTSNTDIAMGMIYSPDGKYMIYFNCFDRGKLYKKNANDSSLGSPITSVKSYNPSYSPDGKYIIYANGSDGNKLYKKNANDTSNGSPINSVSSQYSIYSPDGNYIVYTNNNDGNKLYKKNANDVSNGFPINSDKSYYAKYSPDGKDIIYFNMTNWKIYIKNAHDNSNGSALINIQFTNHPAYSPDGRYIIYSNHTDGYNLYRLTLPQTPVISSLISNQPSINSINENSVGFSLNGITDLDEGNIITYSYSFDNVNFTNLATTQTAPIQNGTYNFNIDFSSQPDGNVTIYVKANDGTGYSNVVSLILNKNSSLQVPIAPSGEGIKNITSDSVSYTWIDNSSGDYEEEKYIIKDELDNIVIDNIAANTNIITESSLIPNNQYQRKICAQNGIGEACSNIVVFTTKAEVTGGKTTTFSFAGISIDVIESVEMFKVVFSIGGFKINFSIETT